ncbi:MAG: 16S rRNA (guanine(966)-N(2))-methyltransferase RsmD [Bacteroidales bacterium]|nr:16S rRNA (guanine(966)-N(2))-methyltransferase RsmD [Bacteroidales bacterium]HOK99876.1 16S rRNA (guanine(966)-N(2))-methyltransferase RsmD [Bacteroidales bacterium]HPO66284.1 16S rRNA (guanine(966)-N(2))-methyltransferase RsmD [Bacteroidales bacterium]
MRIIGGKYKGRILKGKVTEARPTTDFAKESLFNILNNYYFFEEISVLDLFAGTGAISFEFASRGCQQIDLIEWNPHNYQFICNNIKELELAHIKPLKADVFQYLRTCNKKYDVIFADPPYEMEGIAEIPDLIFSRQMLKPEGMLILEHSKNIDFQQHSKFWQYRKYGAVHFSFFLP